MPQVTRIRTTNAIYGEPHGVFYNQDMKLRLDCGNTVLHAVNGTGKSTLFQLWQDAYDPYETRGRESSVKNQFFTHNKAPVASLQELKLDNGAGYITVGVVYALSNKSAAMPEEKLREAVRYFNFIIEHDTINERHPLDIFSDDFLYTEEGHIEKWNGIRDKLRQNFRAPASVRGRIFDSKGDYEEALLEFGIDHDELKIQASYSKEGAFKGYLVSTHNTSDKVVHGWAIGSILRVYPDWNPASLTNISQVRHMALSHKAELKFNREMPKYEKLLERNRKGEMLLTEMQDPLGDVLDGKQILRNRYEELLASEENYEKRAESLKDSIEENRDAIRRLRKAKVSRKYHLMLRECDEKKKAVAELEEKRQKSEEKRSAHKDAVRLQEFVKIKEEKQRAEEEKSALEEALKRSTADEVSEMNRLSSTLCELAEEKLAEKSRQIDELSKGIEDAEEEKQELQERLKENRRHVMAYSKDATRAELEAKQHIAYVSGLDQTTQIALPPRELSAAPYDMVVLRSEEERLEGEHNAAEKTVKKASKKLNDMRNRFEKASEEETRLKSKITASQMMVESRISDRREQTEKKDASAPAFGILRIDPDLPADDAFSRANKVIRAVCEDIGKKREEEEAAKKKLTRIRNRTILTNTDFGDFLRSRDIHYRTGEQMLEDMSGEKRRETLERIPYFASAYIISRDYYKEMEAFKDELCGLNIGMVPVLTDPNAPLGAGDIQVFMDRDMTDPEKRREAESRCENAIERLGTEIRNALESEAELNTALRNLQEYYTSCGEIERINEALAKERAELEEKTVQLEKAAEETAGFRAGIESAEKKLAEAEEKEAELSSSCSKMTELIAKEAEYGAVLERLEDIRKALDTLGVQIEEDEERSRRIDEEQDIRKETHLKRKSERETLRSEAAEYSVCAEGREEGTYEMLRARFEAVRDSIKSTADATLAKIASREDAIRHAESEMAEPRFEAVDRKKAESVSYDEGFLAEERARLVNVEADIRTLEHDLIRERSEKDIMLGKFENFRSQNFGDEDPLPLEEINMDEDYDAGIRSRQENNTKLEESIDNLEECDRRISDMKSAIGAKVNVSKIAASETTDVIEPDELEDTEEAVSGALQDLKYAEALVMRYRSALKALAQADGREDYGMLRKMNLTDAFAQTGLLYLDHNDYEAIYEKAEAQRRYFNGNVHYIENYIQDKKREMADFEQNLNAYTELIYDNLKRLVEHIFKLSAMSKYMIDGKMYKTIKISAPKGTTLRPSSSADDEYNKIRLTEYVKSVMAALGDILEERWEREIREMLSINRCFKLFGCAKGWRVEILKVNDGHFEYSRPPGDDDGYFSGGQAVCGSFFMLMTEIAYRRDERGNGVKTSFFMLDNPFGEMNLKGGVQAMFDVAKGAGVQLIVATPHSEPVTMRNFDCVISIKVENHGEKHVLRPTTAYLRRNDENKASENGEQTTFLN